VVKFSNYIEDKVPYINWDLTHALPFCERLDHYTTEVGCLGPWEVIWERLEGATEHPRERGRGRKGGIISF
jgi:hypothetical protein